MAMKAYKIRNLETPAPLTVSEYIFIVLVAQGSDLVDAEIWRRPEMRHVHARHVCSSKFSDHTSFHRANSHNTCYWHASVEGEKRESISGRWEEIFR